MSCRDSCPPNIRSVEELKLQYKELAGLGKSLGVCLGVTEKYEPWNNNGNIQQESLPSVPPSSQHDTHSTNRSMLLANSFRKSSTTASTFGNHQNTHNHVNDFENETQQEAQQRQQQQEDREFAAFQEMKDLFHKVQEESTDLCQHVRKQQRIIESQKVRIMDLSNKLEQQMPPKFEVFAQGQAQVINTQKEVIEKQKNENLDIRRKLMFQQEQTDELQRVHAITKTENDELQRRLDFRIRVNHEENETIESLRAQLTDMDEIRRSSEVLEQLTEDQKAEIRSLKKRNVELRIRFNRENIQNESNTRRARRRSNRSHRGHDHEHEDDRHHDHDSDQEQDHQDDSGHDHEDDRHRYSHSRLSSMRSSIYVPGPIADFEDENNPNTANEVQQQLRRGSTQRRESRRSSMKSRGVPSPIADFMDDNIQHHSRRGMRRREPGTRPGDVAPPSRVSRPRGYEVSSSTSEEMDGRNGRNDYNQRDISPVPRQFGNDNRNGFQTIPRRRRSRRVPSVTFQEENIMETARDQAMMGDNRDIVPSSRDRQISSKRILPSDSKRKQQRNNAKSARSSVTAEELRKDIEAAIAQLPRLRKVESKRLFCDIAADIRNVRESTCDLPKSDQDTSHECEIARGIVQKKLTTKLPLHYSYQEAKEGGLDASRECGLDTSMESVNQSHGRTCAQDTADPLSESAESLCDWNNDLQSAMDRNRPQSGNEDDVSKNPDRSRLVNGLEDELKHWPNISEKGPTKDQDSKQERTVDDGKSNGVSAGGWERKLKELKELRPVYLE